MSKLEWVKEGLRPLHTDIGIHRSKKERVDTNSANWKKKKEKLINKKGSHCQFCGCHYDKYLYCYNYQPDKKKEKLVLSCRLCYIITHSNFGFTDEIRLCYSKKSQRFIIRKTVRHLLKNGTVPAPEEIDPEVQRINLSMVEYVALLHEVPYRKLPKPMKSYKIFFTDQLDTKFLQIDRKFRFLNPDSDSPYDDPEFNSYFETEQEDHLPVHKFTRVEMRTLTGCFGKPRNKDGSKSDSGSDYEGENESMVGNKKEKKTAARA